MGCDFIGFRIVVVPVYFMIEFPFLTVIIVNLVEQFLVEINPFLKSKFLTEYARCDVSGY